MTDRGYAYIPDDFGEPDAPAVAADVPCRRCGYNLRGLPTDGRCPECGTPVGLSVRGGLIRYSDPAWIDRLRFGVNCLLAYAVVTVVAGVATGVGALALALATGGKVKVAAFQAGHWVPVLTAVGLVGQALYLVGIWLLTAPDPAGLGEDQYGGPRRLIRVAAVTAAAGGLAPLARAFGALRPELAAAVAVATGGCQLASAVATVACLVYLGRLAARLPDPGLAGLARVVTYGLGIPLGIVATSTIALGLLAAARGPALVTPGGLSAGLGAFVALGCVTGLAGLAKLGFYIVYLVLLVRFGGRFKEQAALARQTWATDPGGMRPPSQ